MIATKVRSGGEVLAAALRKHGVDLIFGVPGESYLAALDGFYGERDALRFIGCRHEGAAAHMAEAYGKLTGRPGVCIVTRGPGATQASIGVHTAMQDSTPMILLVGQVAREMRGREAWQEIDVRSTFSTLAKWAEQIDDARRLPEIISRAFYTATSGRPGPVVLALPEDMLTDEVDVEDAEPFKVVQPSASPEQLEEVRVMLARAERPLVLVGGGGWDAQACDDLRCFAEMHGLPVVTTFRRQDLFDNRHTLYAGHAGLGMDAALAQRIQDADLLLAIGPRLGETSTNGYRLLAIPRPLQRLIHVHPSASELGRVYAADLPINAGTASFVHALAKLRPPELSVWKRWAASAHQDYVRRFRGTPSARALDMTAAMHYLCAHLPKDAILTNGAGNYAIWLHRYYQYAQFRTQLAPNSGAMGYGLPAAIAAKLVHPERTVVNVAGDGCFLMTAQELATAVRHELSIVILVVNNTSYGSIRAHQEMHYPGRVIGTDLTNPDFVAFARSFGAYAERVDTTEQFAAAFERARSAGRPALLELRTDPDVLTPEADIATMRRRAR